MRLKIETYLPNKQLKKVPQNLVPLEVEVKGLTKNKTALIKLQQSLNLLNRQLINSYVNPFTLNNLAKWIFKRLKGYIGPEEKIIIHLKCQQKELDKVFQQKIKTELLGLEKYELCLNTTKKIRATQKKDWQQAYNLLQKKKNLKLLTIFCPPYSKDWITGKYKGFFSSIEIDPQTQDNWNYDYKHFFYVFNRLIEILQKKYLIKISGEIFIADLLINKKIFSKKDQEDIQQFVHSANNYLRSQNYPLHLTQLSRIKTKVKIPTTAPETKAELLNFIQKFSSINPEIKEILNLINLPLPELESLLFSDYKIYNFLKKNYLSSDLYSILKCAGQITKLNKNPAANIKDGLLQALKKYISYHLFMDLITQEQKDGIFISLDTSFSYAANFFRTPNIPVLHINPWKLKRKKYSYLKSHPSLTIIIPVHNDPLLPQLLESIKRIAKDKKYGQFKTIEILIVSNGQDTMTSQQISSAMQNFEDPVFTIRHLHLPPQGIGRARNYGCEKAWSNIIAFIDADCELDLDYFEKLSLYLNQIKQKQILRGQVEFCCQKPQKDFIKSITTIRNYYYQKDKEKLYTPNLILKKETFYKSGQFKTDLINGEDNEWDFRCKQIGIKGIYQPQIKIKHWDQGNLTKITNNWKAYGWTRGVIIKKQTQSTIKRLLQIFSLFFTHAKDLLILSLTTNRKTILFFLLLEKHYFFGLWQSLRKNYNE